MGYKHSIGQQWWWPSQMMLALGAFLVVVGFCIFVDRRIHPYAAPLLLGLALLPVLDLPPIRSKRSNF